MLKLVASIRHVSEIEIDIKETKSFITPGACSGRSINKEKRLDAPGWHVDDGSIFVSFYSKNTNNFFLNLEISTRFLSISRQKIHFQLTLALCEILKSQKFLFIKLNPYIILNQKQLLVKIPFYRGGFQLKINLAKKIIRFGYFKNIHLIKNYEYFCFLWHSKQTTFIVIGEFRKKVIPLLSTHDGVGHSTSTFMPAANSFHIP